MEILGLFGMFSNNPIKSLNDGGKTTQIRTCLTPNFLTKNDVFGEFLVKKYVCGRNCFERMGIFSKMAPPKIPTSFGKKNIPTVAGQIIATSHDRFSPNGGLVREIPLFQGNLGW